MIIAAGIFNLAIAVFHILLGRILHWPERLEVLDRANRGAMRLLNVALIILLTMMGIAFIFFTQEIVATQLGRFLLTAMLMFWSVRLILQPVYLGWTSRSSLRAIAVLATGMALHGGALWGALR